MHLVMRYIHIHDMHIKSTLMSKVNLFSEMTIYSELIISFAK